MTQKPSFKTFILERIRTASGLVHSPDHAPGSELDEATYSLINADRKQKQILKEYAILRLANRTELWSLQLLQRNLFLLTFPLSLKSLPSASLSLSGFHIMNMNEDNYQKTWIAVKGEDICTGYNCNCWDSNDIYFLHREPIESDKMTYCQFIPVQRKQIVKEYAKLATRTELSDSEAERMGEILEIAQSDDVLCLLMNEVDNLISENQDNCLFGKIDNLINEVQNNCLAEVAGNDYLDGGDYLENDDYLESDDYLKSDYNQLLKEYARLATRTELSDSKAERMGEILEIAQSDDVLCLLMNEVDNLISENQDNCLFGYTGIDYLDSSEYLEIVTATSDDDNVISVLGQASQEFDNIITVSTKNELDRTACYSFSVGSNTFCNSNALFNTLIINYILDVSDYQGELAIFSLEGMDKFKPGSHEFIQEAAHRALSDSVLGHVIISDQTEGAKFSGFLGEGDRNSGKYLGVKTFEMRPGDEFGFMLVPNGQVQQVFDNPEIGGAVRPLFSLATANPEDAFHTGQIADVTGDGSLFVFENLRVDGETDKDYNDIIFQVRGAVGKTKHLNESIITKKIISGDKDKLDLTLEENLKARTKANINNVRICYIQRKPLLRGTAATMSKPIA